MTGLTAPRPLPWLLERPFQAELAQPPLKPRQLRGDLWQRVLTGSVAVGAVRHTFKARKNRRWDVGRIAHLGFLTVLSKRIPRIARKARIGENWQAWDSDGDREQADYEEDEEDMEDEDSYGEDQYISIKELYGLLKEAPSSSKALQLAGKLRKAAKMQRKMIDGRMIDVQDVDEAMDILLSSMQQQKEAQEIEEESQSEPDSLRDELWADKDGKISRGKWQPQLNDQNEVVGSASNTPVALHEEVIGLKFNMVDRVWSAVDSRSLPTAAWSEEDNNLESAWMRLPHVCVTGMTNCGKSSMLNHVLRWKCASKASSVPGKTDSIDFYVVNNRFVLVDMPGYPDHLDFGHQGVIKKWDGGWQDLVFRYLALCREGRYDLRLLLHLQNISSRPTRFCRQFVAHIQNLGLPMLMVLAKDDHLRKYNSPAKQRKYFSQSVRRDLDFRGFSLHYTCRTKKEDGKVAQRAKKQICRWIRTAVVEAKSGDEMTKKLQEVWDNARRKAEEEQIRTGDVKDPFAVPEPKGSKVVADKDSLKAAPLKKKTIEKEPSVDEEEEAARRREAQEVQLRLRAQFGLAESRRKTDFERRQRLERQREKDEEEDHMGQPSDEWEAEELGVRWGPEMGAQKPDRRSYKQKNENRRRQW